MSSTPRQPEARGTTGAVAGGVLVGALGWLVGIGSLAIPGVGPLIAAGPILAALTGAAAGGAVGGLTGGLIGLGIPEYEAKRYEGAIRVTVNHPYLRCIPRILAYHARAREAGLRARECQGHFVHRRSASVELLLQTP